MKSRACFRDIQDSNFSFGRYITALSNRIVQTDQTRQDQEVAHLEVEDVGVTHMTEMMFDDGLLTWVLHVASSTFERNSNPTFQVPMD
jgi:hypothetical protein